MSAVLVISRDSEFASSLSEHIKRELALEVHLAASIGEALPLAAEVTLAVTEEDAPADFPVPVLNVSRARGPIRLQALLAEIAALRTKPAQEVALGAMRFHPRLKQVVDTAGNAAELTDREAGLLQALASAGDAGISRDALLRDVWGFEADINTHTLETHIYRLRSKLRDAFGTEIIEATQGGYKIVL